MFFATVSQWILHMNMNTECIKSKHEMFSIDLRSTRNNMNYLTKLDAESTLYPPHQRVNVESTVLKISWRNRINIQN